MNHSAVNKPNNSVLFCALEDFNGDLFLKIPMTLNPPASILFSPTFLFSWDEEEMLFIGITDNPS